MEPRRQLSLKMSSLNYIHPKVDPDHLSSNGMLLSDAEILQLKKRISDQPDGRYTKLKAKSPYPIIKFANRYFAVYKGLKSDSELGKGGEGYAKLAQDLDSGTFYVVKAKRLGRGREKYSENEIEILKQVGALVLDVDGNSLIYDWSPSRKKTYQAKHKSEMMSHILLKLIEGMTIDEYISNVSSGHMKSLPMVKCLKLMTDVLTKVEMLYRQKGILHCDLKLENILASLDMKAELIDWSFAEKVSSTGVARAIIRGTPKYIAPEIYREDVMQEPSILMRNPVGPETNLLVAMTHFMLQEGIIRLPKRIFDDLEAKFPKKAQDRYFVQLKQLLESNGWFVADEQAESAKKINAERMVTRTERDQVYALGIVFAELAGFMKIHDKAIFLEPDHASEPRLEKLYKTIQKMIEHDPARRFSLVEAKNAMQDLLKSLPASDRDVSVAIVKASELQDYYSAGGVSWSDSFIHALRDFDEVYLFNDGVADDVLTRIHHYLCKEANNVMNRVIVGAKMEADNINAMFDLLESENSDYSYTLKILDVSKYDRSEVRDLDDIDSDKSENSSMALARSVSRNWKDLSSHSNSDSDYRSSSHSSYASDSSAEENEIGGETISERKHLGLFKPVKTSSQPTDNVKLERSHTGSLDLPRLKPPKTK